MKVLHLIDHLGPGGTQMIIKNFFEAQKNNEEIFLYFLGKKKINMPVYHANTFGYPSRSKYSFGPLAKVKNIIKREKIGIIICHLFRSQIFGYMLKKIYFPNIKLIFYEHGEILQNHKYYNLSVKIMEHHVDKFISVSESAKEELVKKANIAPEKIKVIYNFIDLKKFGRKNIGWNILQEKEKLGFKKNDFIIGFAGRLAKVKGCEYLIRALPLLNFKYKVLIAGDGSEKEKLRELVKSLGIRDKVIFLGYRNDMEKIYSLLDVLVVPSLSESFGNSIMEARAMQVPIIASDLPAIRETLKYTRATLFKMRNYRELAEKITLLRYNPVRISKDKSASSLENYLKNLNRILKDLNKKDLLKNNCS